MKCHCGNEENFYKSNQSIVFDRLTKINNEWVMSAPLYICPECGNVIADIRREGDE